MVLERLERQQQRQKMARFLIFALREPRFGK